MSILQSLIKLLPRTIRDSVQLESEKWILTCPCGQEQSVWQAGGVRYKAKGTPIVVATCPKCGPTGHRCAYRP